MARIHKINFSDNPDITYQINDAEHEDSFAYGTGLETTKSNQAVFGQYNNTEGDAVFAIGGGSADNARQNLFEVNSKGNAIVTGKLYVNNGKDEVLTSYNGEADALNEAKSFSVALNNTGVVETDLRDSSVQIPVNGVLPVANGGTGVTDPTVSLAIGSETYDIELGKEAKFGEIRRETYGLTTQKINAGSQYAEPEVSGIFRVARQFNTVTVHFGEPSNSGNRPLIKVYNTGAGWAQLGVLSADFAPDHEIYFDFLNNAVNDYSAAAGFFHYFGRIQPAAEGKAHISIYIFHANQQETTIIAPVGSVSYIKGEE